MAEPAAAGEGQEEHSVLAEQQQQRDPHPLLLRQRALVRGAQRPGVPRGHEQRHQAEQAAEQQAAEVVERVVEREGEGHRHVVLARPFWQV